MDDDILKTVESMLGPNVRIVDCEKVSTVREEEVLLINGVPIQLDGEDGAAIRSALLTGTVPPCDLLNQLLFRAGIVSHPVRLDTSLSVTSTLVTREEVTVARDGRVLDERSTETKEDNCYSSSCSEVWEPVRILPMADVAAAKARGVPLNRMGTDSPIVTSPTPSKTTSLSSLHRRRGSSCESIVANIVSSSDEGLLSPSASNVFSTTSSSSSSENTTATTAPSSVNNNPSAKISCDSGNDVRFDHLRRIPSAQRNANLRFCRTPSSMSSCCELLSSIDHDDDAEFDEDEDDDDDDEEEDDDGDETDFRRHSSLVDEVLLQDFRATSGFCSPPPMSPVPPSSGSHVYMAGQPQHTMPSIFEEQTVNSSKKEVTAGHRRHGSCASSTGGLLDDQDEHSLVYRDGVLISALLDSLIQHMVPTSDYYPDKPYLFAFLLSSRLFLRPHQLLERICCLCDAQQQLGLDMAAPSHVPIITRSVPPTTTAESSRRFAANFVRLLAEWIDTFPYDFRDERLMHNLRRMTQKCIQLEPARRRDVSAMLQTLLHRLTLLDQYEEYLGRVQCGADAASNHIESNEHDDHPNTTTHHPSAYPQVIDFTEVCATPAQLAHQLTHIELERLSHIGPEEFVQAFAKEHQQQGTNITTSDHSSAPSVSTDMKKTRNLESYVAWFNRLSSLVAQEIVKHLKKKQRVRVVEYWIETARECFNIGNFNSLMAIIAGLNMSPISRLKKTWAKAQSAKFMVLEHQMDPTSNFHSYRSTLKAAMWRSAGATDEQQRIVVPFFSLLVKDLYFLNEGCSNRLPNGHINFDKFWQLAKQVQEFIGWKQVQCTFDRQSRVTWMLQTVAVLSENGLAMASFECEPPDNAAEKDRYKALKAEASAAAAFANSQHHPHQSAQQTSQSFADHGTSSSTNASSSSMATNSATSSAAVER